MNMTKWHKGPPPEIGWWPASVYKDKYSLRWWNGKYWSGVAFPYHDAHYAAFLASHHVSFVQPLIEWTERWWLEPGTSVLLFAREWVRNEVSYHTGEAND